MTSPQPTVADDIGTTNTRADGPDSRCWEMSDMVAMIEEWEAVKKRGLYKKVA